MAISLTPSIFTVELEQLQQTPDSSVNLARESLLTGVAPDPLVLETSGPELKILLDLLASMEVRSGLLRVQEQEVPDGK